MKTLFKIYEYRKSRINNFAKSYFLFYFQKILRRISSNTNIYYSSVNLKTEKDGLEVLRSSF